MKPPPALLLSYFILLLLSDAACSAAHYIYHPVKSFHRLVGSRKGDTVTGIGDVKSYLEYFGYLNNLKHNSYQANDRFDDPLEKALLKYQSFFKLNKTGLLDNDTVSMMSQPRCGNKDIETRNGSRDGPPSVRFPKHYNFYWGWPKRTKDKLYVVIQNSVPAQLVDALSQAFADWEPFVPLVFLKTLEPGGVEPDIRAGFFKRDHGDGRPFDGPGKVLAHASRGEGDMLHFDAEENWTVGVRPNWVDITTVARHEIGHLLGLAHSDEEAALMYPVIHDGATKDIGDDDKAGIKALYFG